MKIEVTRDSQWADLVLRLTAECQCGCESKQLYQLWERYKEDDEYPCACQAVDVDDQKHTCQALDFELSDYENVVYKLSGKPEPGQGVASGTKSDPEDRGNPKTQ